LHWPLQDAKNRFSEVVKRARIEGPQTVTLHGKPAAVVLSAEEFDRLSAGEESIVDTLLSPDAPWDDEFAAEVAARDTTPLRDL
jgi:prevent-host-death family protein